MQGKADVYTGSGPGGLSCCDIATGKENRMKKYDITDKLTFDGNPVLVIKGKELEVNADAPTMLKVMNFFGSDGVEIEQINQAYELIFPDKSRKEIEKMKLSVKDWMTVVQEAVGLVVGESDGRGEQ